MNVIAVSLQHSYAIRNQTSLANKPPLSTTSSNCTPRMVGFAPSSLPSRIIEHADGRSECERPRVKLRGAGWTAGGSVRSRSARQRGVYCE